MQFSTGIGGVILDDKDRVVMRMFRNPKTHRLWFLEIPRIPIKALHTFVSNHDLAKLRHHCLGHSHPNAVIKFLRVHESISLSRRDFLPCDSCAMGKLSQSPAVTPFHRAPGVLNVIHIDILGLIHPQTPSGSRYILTFIEDHTPHNEIYLLKHKSDAFETFKEYKMMMERRMEANIVKLKSDRGGEYSSTEFLCYLKSCGVTTKRGPAKWPQANSVSERFNFTLLSKIRTQLIESGLPLNLCGEAAKYSSLQINSTPTKSLDLDIPLQRLESLTPTHVHPFNFD